MPLHIHTIQTQYMQLQQLCLHLIHYSSSCSPSLLVFYVHSLLFPTSLLPCKLVFHTNDTSINLELPSQFSGHSYAAHHMCDTFLLQLLPPMLPIS